MSGILNKKTGAFTLAEVLVTLAVIGIVAAMTIPSLLKNYQEKQFKTAWKKAYSSINQATLMILAENSGSLLNVTTSCDSITQLYAEKMKALNVCSGTPECFHTEYDWTQCKQRGFVLDNGMLIKVISWGSHDCDYNFTGNYGGADLKRQGGFLDSIKECVDFIVDVNGFKGPNEFSKDIFAAVATDTSFQPYGQYPDYYSRASCNCEIDSDNCKLGCSSYVLKNKNY